MVKLKEITELLINEIASFEKTVNDLKKQSQLIAKINLKPETTDFDHMLSEHIEDLKRMQNSFSKQLEKSTKQQQLSKFQVIILLSMFMVSLGALLYVNYTNTQAFKKEEQAYQQGVTDVKKHINTFFEATPKAKKAYDKWKKQ